MYRKLGSYFLKRSLQSNFENIFWVGNPWSVSDEQSLVVYSNHHSYYDGYLAWWFFSQHLKRPYKIWMEDLDRFPQFGPLGALPFSPDDAKERASTIRKSAELLKEMPGQVIHFMPEGRLSPPQAGLGEFRADLERFDSVFSNKMWCPFVIYISWNGGPKPVAFLAAGDLHGSAAGDERENLENLLTVTTKQSLTNSSILMQGAEPTQDRWNFSFAKKLFEN